MADPSGERAYVLLEHDTRPQPDDPAAATHWDLMIEQAGALRLDTWRLAGNPLHGSATLPAERIADHRRAYLEFEGELGGGRGRVRRVARGTVRVAAVGDGLRLSFASGPLAGDFLLNSDGTLARMQS